MTPTPQEQGTCLPQTDLTLADGDRIVISGMAGLYPQATNVKDLEKIIYNKVNPVSSGNLRWKNNHPEVSEHIGMVPDLDLFDAQFFKVHYRQGHCMDPLGRKLLEKSHEAIYDAGVSPDQLYGKKVGVFIGTSISESEKMAFYVSEGVTGMGLTGCSRNMFANRISYWLNAKGPSLNIDEACCSSTVALEQAYQAIARGECESAIVGGASLCLHPQSAVHIGRALKLSADGKTRSFDQNATGTAISEAINVLFLQKAKNALRIYADVLHVKCAFSLKSHVALTNGFCRNVSDNTNFLREFYKEAGVPPSLVEYVEAFGAANPDSDKAELEAIDEIYCRDRNNTLLVGSVMSNIGYTGSASGISAVTKVLLGFNRGELAGNLNYDTPRNDVAGLYEGRIRILDDSQRFQPSYAAVNNLSVTGINGHVLLRGHFRAKDIYRYKSSIPRLVNVSGRQESAVQKIFNELKSYPVDLEQIALLHKIHEGRISGHLGRGYIILDDSDVQNLPVTLSEKADYFDDTRRPLWFVYSGMGSQWAGMGAQLMRIPIFAAAIERCNRVLESKGIDIVHIICSADKSIFQNILHSFVGIAAVQIGLTDVLNELGLVPDNIIGHSVGELGCAYADGCLTAEEMILSAYSRGLVSSETTFIRGSMAAVGAGFDQMSKICPPEIEIACHNGPDSCTISGPAESMGVFIEALTAKGIFAKEVPCSNIAFHSRYIAKAGPGLLKYLNEIIKTPKARSERWISTSVPQDRWQQPLAGLSSAEYHTNNLLSPVLFEEASKLIPSNAVLVEVAPHGLLQAILKRSLPSSCTNIPLTRRGHPDNALMVLEAIGKLYVEGYNPKIRVLYPKVEFPVSCGTPYLSNLVEWAHEEKWKLYLYASADRKFAAACEFLVSVYDDEYSYLKGNVIRQKTLLPFSFALVAVWDTLSMSMNFKKKSMDVKFTDVQFYTQPILYDHLNSRLSVSLHKGNGQFEVMNGNSRVASGFINYSELDNLKGFANALRSYENAFELNSEDVYELLQERDYSYNGDFRCIENVDAALNKANLLWNNNWVTLIDGMIQLNVLKQNHNSVSQPDQIGRITINVADHLKSVDVKHEKKLISTCVDDSRKFTRCGGIVIEEIKFNDLPPANEDHIVVKSLRFVPRFHSDIDVTSSLQVITQIVAENVNKNVINVIGIIEKNIETNSIRAIKQIVEENSLPGIQIQYRQVNKNVVGPLNDGDVVVVQNLSKDDELCQILYSTLQRNAFIVNEESLEREPRTRPSALYKVVSVLESKEQNTRLELARWRPMLTRAESTTTFTIRSESDLPLLITARDNLVPEGCLIILTSYPPVKGVKEIVKWWRKDDIRNHICLVMTKQIEMLDELPDVDLSYSIFNEGEWGGEYYLPQREKEAENVKLQCEHTGDYNSLQWVPAPEPTNDGTLVKVHYAGIHMNDVKRAAGAASFSNTECYSGSGYGMEFSGLTESGERVMGLVPHSAASSHVIAQPELLWPVPSHWTLEDACTVPFAYAYAYYCMNIKTGIRLVEKDVTQFSVLVHGGAGALGQAMISIALANGFRVFATVGDLQKKRFLLRLFPELHEDDIGNSRDVSFGDMVKNATDGKGCNIVLCCLKGELKNISLSCCGSSGTTFDTVLINSKEDYPFGMHYLTNERAYIAVDISSIFTHMKSEDLKALQTMVSDGIALGHVRPLSRVTFAPHEASRAFRLLAASRHRGRVLLRMRDSRPQALPMLACNRNRCHLVLCGKQRLGLQLADMLMRRGANKIHINIPNPDHYLSYKLSLWKKLNAQVTVSSESLTTNNGFADLLYKAMSAAPLDGVYVIADDFLKNSDISGLDLMTRKLCPSLKSFVVINSDGIFGLRTCITRAKESLPATMLDISLLKSVCNNDSTWQRKSMDATVLALRSADSILLTHRQRTPEMPLLQQIAALAVVNISDQTSDNTTLEELGMDPGKCEIVGALLSDKYHISLFEEKIPSLTIQEIKQIDDRLSTKPKFQKVKGLESFYSFVDPDELLATTEMVFLPTLINKSFMRDDEFDLSESFLCILPGLEGHHGRFRTLCERLKVPAFVLQPGLDYPHETPQELARRYAEILLKKMGQKESFNLLGYETGVIAALELAAILEEKGMTGTVYCLGDGPEEIKAAVEAEASAFGSEEALQEGIVRHMSSLMARGAAAKVALRGCGSWRARVDLCVRALLGRVPHSAQYARALLEAAYARIGTARRYSAAPRALRSRLVLLRARRGTDSGEECSLQRYSRRPLLVTHLAAPLPHAAADLRAPAVINRYLDDDILKAFEKKNLCDSYLLNADIYLKSKY